jgi:hypothetical protein
MLELGEQFFEQQELATAHDVLAPANGVVLPRNTALDQVESLTARRVLAGPTCDRPENVARRAPEPFYIL